MSLRLAFVVTCEHASNRVPVPYAPLFENRRGVLQTHEAYDPGSLELGRALGQQLDAPVIATSVTRLLVDANRTRRRPSLFSRFTEGLGDNEKEAIYDQYFRPHRARVLAAIADAQGPGTVVVHVGVHTFTPVIRGTKRRSDVSLLYDPARPTERAFCATWQEALREVAPRWRVRRNYPFFGKSDGMTATGRRRWPDERYLGLELEVNQRLLRAGPAPWRRSVARLVEAFELAVERVFLALDEG